ncbi:LPS assembly lipoprotein LptE [Lacipirellula sp.]|uniref:LPS assembly lipoprotein LptE n=1 Tax=Lacipirellula sp. TaxID=2691419 RepID=UPI003D0C8276
MVRMLRPSAAKLLFALALLGLAAPGCAAYRIGNETLYAPDVTTVYVPMIESDSFRRDLGERLTEAVIKEIELKTPYKVVGTPDADSVLVAKLQGERKMLEFENQNDDPRALEYALTANVTWLNRRRQPLAPMNAIPLPADLVSITQTATMLPEPGQSDASAQQQAIQRLAEQIVATMEEPW